MELVILGYLAKYAERYQVKIYAFAIEGSHLHLLALFPKGNRKDFMRDFASQVAKLIRLTYPGAPRGGIFERRYSAELVPFHKDDIEDRYFYTVLQAVQDCLVHTCHYGLDLISLNPVTPFLSWAILSKIF